MSAVTLLSVLSEGRINLANTVANFPCFAAFPIHHLMAPSLGVFMTNSSVFGSNVAVVCMP